MQDCRKAVWRSPYVSVAFFPSLKQNFIAYRSSKVSSRLDCIFEIHQLWQPGFGRVYSNFCCSCSFEAEIIKIGQPSYKMYNNNIMNFQESTIILNACTKSLETYWMYHVSTKNSLVRSKVKWKDVQDSFSFLYYVFLFFYFPLFFLHFFILLSFSFLFLFPSSFRAFFCIFFSFLS